VGTIGPVASTAGVGMTAGATVDVGTGTGAGVDDRDLVANHTIDAASSATAMAATTNTQIGILRRRGGMPP